MMDIPTLTIKMFPVRHILIIDIYLVDSSPGAVMRQRFKKTFLKNYKFNN